MSDELTFYMGKFEARFPTDRNYAKNHMWAKDVGEQSRTSGDAQLWRFGFTAYAVRLLQDVYFLDWTIDAGTALNERQPIGNIESSKAESELYSPLAGTLVEFNQELLTDPSGINVDKYGRGWLFSMQSAGETLLSPEEYLAHLEAAWKVAERTIKGQMNE
ncbi:MAG TPA: glycine cleavage system protein H [Pirellulales bacterium]|jgi:glycine cleavage system H protein|nr:glycine cleavage system protein H [Pirellulales bacterium]